MRPRRLALLALAALLTVSLAACGRPAQVLEAETEGIYVDIAGLQYQVQTSRQLNATDPADRPFLRGIPPDEPELKAGETWFGIFLRANNPTSQTQPTATEFEVVDSQENAFHPIALGPQNLFAWPLARSVPVPPEGQVPPVGSPAREGTIGGAVLLFRIPIASLQNRPFELLIKGPPADPVEGKVNLDV